jgi:hypothetical protein
LLAGLLAPLPCPGLEYGLRGQASGWTSAIESEARWNAGLGCHYIPQLTLSQSAWDDASFDLEGSLEAFANTAQGEVNDTAAVDLYRLKLRFVTPRTESRLGLQQINFGPAYLLRSLRWFDRLDPRDPLGLTDGVYALNFKYVTQGNSSLWLWLLYGNDDPKGNELLPTLRDEPEGGGRLEVPIPAGEGAFTFHYRRVDGPEPLIEDFAENRFGLDGRWDIAIGLWFEAVLVRQRSEALPYPWNKMLTLGMDYTFPLGNGLHTLIEHMAAVSSKEALEWDEDSNISGVLLSYPVGYADRLSAIPLYYWENREYSLYAAWDHYWDSLALNLSFYRYPGLEGGEGLPGFAAAEGDYEVRVLLIYNH